MLKKTAILLTCCFTLAACSNESAVDAIDKNTETEEVEVVEVEKPEIEAVVEELPIDYSKYSAINAKNPDGTKPTEKMADNGIRADVDKYINSLTITPKQKAALKYDASLFQKVLTVDVSDDAAVTSLSQKMANSLNCINTMFDDMNKSMDTMSEIERMTFNTVEKSDAYTLYNQRQSTAPINMPAGDTCTGF